MDEQVRKRNGSGLIRLPAYPWTARQVFGDLRARLSEELHEPMGFGRLGELMGMPKTTAYEWFETYDNPQVMGFFCCLERLSAATRHAFIDRYCRIFPTLQHPWLTHAPAKVHKVHQLLHKDHGFTLVTNGTEFSRNFLICALGHSYRLSARKGQQIVGLDLHRPDRFVPLDGCYYCDASADANQVYSAVAKVWPKILTSSAGLVVLNGVWDMAERRADILSLAARKHVVLGATVAPDLTSIRRMVAAPLHTVTLSTQITIDGRIGIHCRTIEPLKRPQSRDNR